MLSGAVATFILASAMAILVGLVFWHVARTPARGRCWPRWPLPLPDLWFPPRAAHVRLHRDVGVALPGSLGETRSSVSAVMIAGQADLLPVRVLPSSSNAASVGAEYRIRRDQPQPHPAARECPQSTRPPPPRRKPPPAITTRAGRPVDSRTDNPQRKFGRSAPPASAAQGNRPVGNYGQSASRTHRWCE